MAQEGTQLPDYGSGEPESFFEIDFEADTQQARLDEEEKQRIRQELLSLEW
ncbi:hypothetical protein [Oceanithermus sp.]